MLQLEVAGTIIQLNDDDAALVLYADCKFKGKAVRIHKSGWSDLMPTTAVIIERQINGQSVCAAIFPKIDLSYPSGPEENYIIRTDYPLKLSAKDNMLTLYRGNVTEGYLIE